MSDKVQLIKQEIEKQIEEGKVKCQQYQESNDYESLIAWSEHIATCGKLLVFINSLPKEFANEDLEKEIDKEIDNLCELGCYMEDLAKGNSEGVYPLPDNVVKELRKFACHFTEWQKQQMMKENKVLFEKSSGDCPKELIDIIDKEFGIDGRDENDNPLNGFGDWQYGMILNGPSIVDLVKLGAEWQKQQMMKDAVEGVVHHYADDELAAVHYNDPKGTPMSIYVSSKGLSAGDKVKIIIVKEE